MFVRLSTCAMHRAVRTAFFSSRCSPSTFLSVASCLAIKPRTRRFDSVALCRNLSTSAKKTTAANPLDCQALDENVRTTFDKELTPRVEELLELIEQSRDEGNTEQELKQSLQLYDVLKQRRQQDADVFEVAFGIARIYDDQLEDSGTATIYYRDALAMLEAILTRPSVEGAYMRVTTFGALAMCYENLGQSEDATNYFNDAISAYEEHCDQASKVGSNEVDVSDSDISLLLNLNATAAMIHYHFAGNLLAQERWDEAKNVTKIALELAENSSMSTEELEQLQHCVHELWLELE